ncbi:HU domain-containing protein [Chitinophaga vietnamensis]|uniref:HU domain-containing protein n=1 Tax=Chitinophaga vietnamensis TaxID=2593957 RepID=UPI0011787B45|nr:hypothetical protein [Chitinophaga vietnamensis]
MVLQQYIQEVLFRQRVCVVPHLGTFRIEHFPAQYNVSAQTLTAPRDQVLFTQTWQDDGSCLEWIALKENLVPSVAQRKLEKYLDELKEELKTGKPMILPGIGQLQGDFAGNIHFYAEELPLSQDTLSLRPIRQEEAAPAPAPTPAAPAASITIPPAHAEQQPLEPIMTEEAEETLETITEESGFKWWWAAVPVAAIIGGLAIWWYVSNQSTPVAMPTPNTDTVKHESLTPADSLQQADSTHAALTATPTLNYFAVVAEFADSVKALKFEKRQKGWGREVVMYKRNDLFKVAVPLSGADSLKALDSIKAAFGNKAYLEY